MMEGFKSECDERFVMPKPWNGIAVSDYIQVVDAELSLFYEKVEQKKGG